MENEKKFFQTEILETETKIADANLLGDSNEGGTTNTPTAQEEHSKGNNVFPNEEAGKTPTQTEDGAEQKPSEKEPKKVETRGRHKKDCICPVCSNKRKKEAQQQATKEPKAQENETDEQKQERKRKQEEDFFKEFQEQPPAQVQAPAQVQSEQSQKIDLSKFISGTLFLIVCDSFIPNIILKVAAQTNEKWRNVDAKKLKLTAEERKELGPLADEMVKVILGRVSPILGFFIVYGVLTGTKMMMLEEEDFKPKKKKNE